MVSTKRVICVMFELSNPLKANPLFGLGFRTWDIVGMKRFKFAAIE